MSVKTAEQAAANWLKAHGVRVAEPAPPLTARLSPRCGKSVPEAVGPVAAVLTVLGAGILGYQFLRLLPGVERADLPSGGYMSLMAAMVSMTAWLHRRAGDRRAAAQLGVRRLDRPRPPWREVLGGWYVTSLAITFGGGAVLGIALAATGSLWGVFWLALLAVGAVVDAVILTGVIRRPVLAQDESSLAVDVVTRLEDVQLALPSLFAVPVVVDVVLEHPPGKPWLVGYVVLAVATHVVAWFAQRRRTPALPVDGSYGVPA
ncbi:hypothetical protein AB0J40_17365 [Amycolatopsis sp. NPDC049691]|uniref:hypothetical protein n=1 Tax=Amycolatopsis sp. NPDC049691 TaxID=3155155 RepID=UPI003447545D